MNQRQLNDLIQRVEKLETKVAEFEGLTKGRIVDIRSVEVPEKTEVPKPTEEKKPKPKKGKK